MEKYGFVYIWYDRKHKRYYVGSHWGTTDDGYVCSSTWMRNAYRRRPNDFRRRIIKLVEDRTNLYETENYYLNMIQPDEMGSKYYNLRSGVKGHWHLHEDKRTAVSDKISASRQANPIKFTDEYRENMRQKITGKKRTEETKRNMSEARKRFIEANPGFKTCISQTEEAKKKIKHATWGSWNDPTYEGYRR